MNPARGIKDDGRKDLLFYISITYLDFAILKVSLFVAVIRQKSMTKSSCWPNL